MIRNKLWGGLEMVPAWSHKPNYASSILAPATSFESKSGLRNWLFTHLLSCQPNQQINSIRRLFALELWLLMCRPMAGHGILVPRISVRITAHQLYCGMV